MDDDSEAEKLSPLLVSEKCIEMTEFNTQERKENAEVDRIEFLTAIFAIIFKLSLLYFALLFKSAGKIVHKGRRF